jgi:hypothetical protein
VTVSPNYRSAVSAGLPHEALQLVRAAVKRRTRRGSWAYILWLLAWLPPMVFIASFYLRPYQMLLLIPIIVALVQVVYPTLLGWAVIVIPSVFFTGAMGFFVIVTAPARVQRCEPESLVISSVAAGVYALVCVALWFARPKLADAVVAESGRREDCPPGSHAT